MTDIDTGAKAPTALADGRPARPAHHVAEAGASATARGPTKLSILFPDASGAAHGDQQPEYFADLNLDQFVASVTDKREDYHLAPFFYEHLQDLDVITYRQEVFGDLEQRSTFDHVSAFAEQMRQMRALVEETNKFRYRYQQQGAVIDVIELYTDAVSALESGLRQSDLHARGMVALRDYLAAYVASPAFAALVADTKAIRARLAEVHYTIRIRGARVYVAKYESEPDYSAEVLATFERFEQGAVKDYRVRFRSYAELNHIEARILDLVARLYPGIFAELAEYCTRHGDYLDETLRRFDREVQFYLCYLEYLTPLRATGLDFCFPEVTRKTKEIVAEQTFDLVLATKLRAEEKAVVCNDLSLSGPERIIVISGPNQGGKTTSARLFGQLHHLACIGCLVPGSRARLFLFDRLFTQFEREEDLANMTGKLEDDLLHVRDILRAATPNSVVVLNEIFSSTTLQDSVFLSTRVMERLVELDVLAVFVSFVEELASFGPTTVSMASTIVPDNPAERTYKVVRKPADGLAYALAIAEKYGVTYERLKKAMAR